MSTFAVVAHRVTPTNTRLGAVLTPGQAVTRLRAGDVALGRLDVLPSLDGIEPGWWALETLGAPRRDRAERRPEPRARPRQARDRPALAAAGVPHPRTVHVAPWLPLPELEPPVVLKPRFGSWGRDVVRCDTTPRSNARWPSRRTRRVWFNSTGASRRSSCRRAATTCGSRRGRLRRRRRLAPREARRVADERRARRPPRPRRAAARGEALAVAAAEALGGDLVGVDLLPTTRGGWAVLEVNGAADFTAAYSLGEEVFAAARRA